MNRAQQQQQQQRQQDGPAGVLGGADPGEGEGGESSRADADTGTLGGQKQGLFNDFNLSHKVDWGLMSTIHWGKELLDNSVTSSSPSPFSTTLGNIVCLLHIIKENWFRKMCVLEIIIV